MDFSHTPDTGAGPDPPGSGGYVSARWADWTVLPAINVVNDALFTGAVRETPCLEPFLLKVINLPRQAHDEHRKS